MGTPEFAVPCLEALARLTEVAGVYTQPDRPAGRSGKPVASPVKRRALELGYPVFQPEKLTAPGEAARLAKLLPDLILVVAYGQILRREVLDIPKLGCVNVHASLLPRWRGAAPIQHAILAGDRETGVCTMRMAEKLDAGPVFLESRVPISGGETASTLHDRLAKVGADLIEPTVLGLLRGDLPGRPQDESRVTLAPKITKEMGSLDWRKNAAELDRQIRALNPWPGTWIEFEKGTGGTGGTGGRRVLIREARLLGAASEPGTLSTRAGMLVLGCSGGALEVRRLQWEGRKELSAADFLNGSKDELPARLR